MFRQKKSDEDDEDDFSVSRSSSKLAALFSQESPSKNSKDLKFVAPKQPHKMHPSSEAHVSTVESDSNKMESSSAVLYATAAELFSYKKGTASSEGRVMCCIIRKNEDFLFVLLIYRTKKNVIAQGRIHLNFKIVVQKNNYINFTDDVSTQWSLHIDGVKYQDFLTQIGICRSLSAFRSPSPPPLVTQLLSEGEEASPLQKEDTPSVTVCSWQVQNYKRGKQIEDLKEGVQISLNTNSWEAGLVNCHRGQHCLVFVPNKQVYEADKSSLIAYEVTIESVKSYSEGDGESLAPLHPHKGAEVNNKAALISRMAKVGTPLLPTTPKHGTTLPPTDSESEEDHQPPPPLRAHLGHARSSASSLDDVIGPSKAPRKHSYGHVSDPEPHMGTSPHNAHIAPAFGGQQGPGTMVAYYPFPFPQNQQEQHRQQTHQQQQQAQSSSMSKSSDSLLSLLFSESRAQNTDLRVALSQLTQKVDMVYAKVSSLEQPQASAANLSPAPNSGLVALATPSSPSSSREILAQISAMVEDMEVCRKRAKEAEGRAEEVTRDYTQVLKKNQTLLEEKASLLSERGEGGERKVDLQELLALQEKRVKVEAELGVARAEVKKLQGIVECLKERCLSLERESDHFKSAESKQKCEKLLKLERENEALSREMDKLRRKEEKGEEAQKELRRREEQLREMMRKDEEMRGALRATREERDKYKGKAATLEEEKRARERGGEEQRRKEVGGEEIRHQDLNDERDLIIEKLRKDLVETGKSLNDLKEEIRRNASVLDNPRRDKQHCGGAQMEALVKQIMNATFKRVKTCLVGRDAWGKADILDKVLSAMRDTTLEYLVNSQKFIEDAKDASKGYFPLPAGAPVSRTAAATAAAAAAAAPSAPAGSFVPSIPAGFQPPLHSGDDSLAYVPVSSLPPVKAFSGTPVKALTTDPPVKFSEPPVKETNAQYAKYDHKPTVAFPTLPPAEKTLPPPATEPSLPPPAQEPAGVKSSGGEKPDRPSLMQERMNSKTIEEEDWRPAPPPPPLFSDSEDDDDWLS